MKVKDAIDYLERIKNAQRCLMGMSSIEDKYDNKSAFDMELSDLLNNFSDMINERELK